MTARTTPERASQGAPATEELARQRGGYADYLDGFEEPDEPGTPSGATAGGVR